jgi:hypothetical protein
MTDFAPLTPDNAATQLRSALDAAGFREGRRSIADFWPVFTEWAAQPVDGADPDADADLLLYETLVKEPAIGSARTLLISFTRQLMRLEEGEYAGMEQILADFAYAIDDLSEEAVRTVGDDQFWGPAGPRSAAWCARVERTDSFLLASDGRVPGSFELVQSPV